MTTAPADPAQIMARAMFEPYFGYNPETRRELLILNAGKSLAALRAEGFVIMRPVADEELRDRIGRLIFFIAGENLDEASAMKPVYNLDWYRLRVEDPGYLNAADAILTIIAARDATHAKKLAAATQRAEDAEAQCERMREALKPFGRYAEACDNTPWLSGRGDEERLLCAQVAFFDGEPSQPTVTMGDFRRAALADSKEARDGE